MPVNSNKFILKDYHAVEDAEIILNGITVLAGINGCGKSTISRWLYGYVHYSNDFSTRIELETAMSINNRTNRMIDLQRRLAFLTKQPQLPKTVLFSGNLAAEADTFLDKLNEIVSTVAGISDAEVKEKCIHIISNGLEQDNTHLKNTDEKLDAFRETEERYLTDLLNSAEMRIGECSISDLFAMMREGLGYKSGTPMNMQFVEDGQDLLDYEWIPLSLADGRLLKLSNGTVLVNGVKGRFIPPMGLKRAIYIDSPMAISNDAVGMTEIWNRLKKMLVTPLKPFQEKAMPIIREIQLIMGGNVVVREELASKELRYERNADGLNIPIDEVATGMKAFTYILRLLQNGYLDSETLLIIDEPEVHLHPQWVVKFAEILVLIQKYLGSKIMIASHNPDMVAAINTIATAEGLGNVTNFYQANRMEDSLKYRFEGAGNDISRVFDCFNVAIDKIDTYKPVTNS